MVFKVILSLSLLHAPIATEVIAQKVMDMDSALSSPYSALKTYADAWNSGELETVRACITGGMRDNELKNFFRMAVLVDDTKLQQIFSNFVDKETITLSDRDDMQEVDVYLDDKDDKAKERLFAQGIGRCLELNPDAFRKEFGKFVEIERQGATAKAKVVVIHRIKRTSRSTGGLITQNETVAETEIEFYFVEREKRWLLATEAEWKHAVAINKENKRN